MDGSLPDDDYELARLSRMGADWRKKPKGSPITSGERIRKCFTIEGGRLRHHQVDADRERLAKRTQQGIDAANRRWGRDPAYENDAPAYADALPEQCRNGYENPCPAIPESESVTDTETENSGVVSTPSNPGPVEPADADAAADAIAEFAPAFGHPDPRDSRLAGLLFEAGSVPRLRLALEHLQRAGKRPRTAVLPWLGELLPGALRAVDRAEQRERAKRAEDEKAAAAAVQEFEYERWADERIEVFMRTVVVGGPEWNDIALDVRMQFPGADETDVPPVI